MNKIIVLCGPSGVGKTSLAHFLLNEIPNLKFCVSHTTRKPRISEEDGIDYFFVKLEKFKQMISREDFLEYAEVYGNLYGTSFGAINKVWSNKKIPVFDIDYQGAKSLYERFGEKKVKIFAIEPPSIEELKERLINRGTDSIEIIEQRIEDIKTEIKTHLDFSNTPIVNSDIQFTQEFLLGEVKEFLNDN